MHEIMKIIDEEEKKLKEIDSAWGGVEVIYYDNRPTYMTINVPLKGNKEKISKLETDGWRRTKRRKAQGGYMVELMSKCFPQEG